MWFLSWKGGRIPVVSDCRQGDEKRLLVLGVCEPFVFSLQLGAEQRAREEDRKRHDDNQSQCSPDWEGSR